jgi:glucokinase
MDSQLSIGIDLGATKIAAALINNKGQIFSTRKALTNAIESPQSVCERISKIINELRDEAKENIIGIGIGAPGLVNMDKGIVINSVNLGWRNVEFVRYVQNNLLLHLPIYLLTDTLAFALGEYHFGAAKDHNHLLLITIGSGLGGGIVTDGRLVIGANGYAGAIGHFSLDLSGRQCACGIYGCPEATISGSGLISIVREFIKDNILETSLIESDDMSPQIILDAARSGDKLALEAFKEIGKNLGAVMAACVAILDPEIVVIGGGLGKASYDVIQPIAKRELKNRIPPEIFSRLLFSPSLIESSAMGAAIYAFEKESNNLKRNYQLDTYSSYSDSK